MTKKDDSHIDDANRHLLQDGTRTKHQIDVNDLDTDLLRLLIDNRGKEYYVKSFLDKGLGRVDRIYREGKHGFYIAHIYFKQSGDVEIVNWNDLVDKDHPLVQELWNDKSN